MKNRKLMTEAKEISKLMKLADLGSYSKKVLKEGRFGEEEEEDEVTDAPEDDMGAGDELGGDMGADDMGAAPEMPDIDMAPEPEMGAPAGGAATAEDVADAIIKALQGMGLVEVEEDGEGELEGTADELPEPEVHDEEETEEDEEEDENAMLQEKVLQRVKQRIVAEKVTKNVINRLKEMQAAQKKPAAPAKKPAVPAKKK